MYSSSNLREPVGVTKFDNYESENYQFQYWLLESAHTEHVTELITSFKINRQWPITVVTNSFSRQISYTF